MLRFFAAILLLSVTLGAQSSFPPSNAKIVLERGGCLGTCPAYTLTISADGSVVYEGKAFVHCKGIRHSKIKKSEVDTLFRAFKAARFFDLSGGGIVNDAPMAVLSLTMGGRQKELREGCDCPPKLVALENEVDKTANSEKWVRGRLKILLHWPWVRL